MPHNASFLLRAAALATALLPSGLRAQQTPVAGRERDPLSSPNGVPHMAGEPANALLIAQAPAVQSELKLTDAQKARIQRLGKAAAQQSEAAPARPELYGEGEPQGNGPADNERALARILDQRQRARMHQIVLQAEGPLAIIRPAVADKLNLDPDQIAAIQTLMAQWQQSQNQVLQATRANGALAAEPNPDEYAKLRLASSRLRKRAAEQINQILNRRQKAILDRMLGPAFDLGKLNGAPAATADPSKPDAGALDNSKDEATAKEKGSDNPKTKANTPKKRRGRRSTSKTSP